MKHPDGGDSGTSCLDMDSTWGTIRICVAGARVVSCVLPRLRAEPHRPFRWRRSTIAAARPGDEKILKQADQYVRSVFRGKPCSPPPFEWPRATPFTLRVWRSLASIPAGSVLEYGALASRIGRPGGARAVGRACGANPLPLFVPCHRVLPKDGTLGGFTGGLPWKRLLLDRERTR